MAIYGSTYPYYRDPRDELNAINALANAGRPADVMTPEARSSAVSALANAGRPQPEPDAIDTPPDDGPVDSSTADAVSALLRSRPAPPPDPAPAPQQPDPAIEDALRANAARALAGRVPAPPTPEPEPDPAIAESQRVNAASALASLKPAPIVPEPPPDPEIARQRDANGARSLARTGKAIAPVVVREGKAPPVPFSGKFDMEFTPDEVDRASAAAKPKPDMVFDLGETEGRPPVVDPGRKLNPEQFDAAARAYAKKPDMAFTVDEADKGLSDKFDQTLRDENAASRTKLDSQLTLDGAPPLKTPTDVSAQSSLRPPEPTASSTSPQPHPIAKESVTVVAPAGSDKPAAITKQIDVAQPESSSLADRVHDANQNDPIGAALGAAHAGGAAVGGAGGPPGVNGWALVADFITNHGKGLGGIIAQAEAQKQQWLARQDKHKDDALNDEYKRAQIEHLNKTGSVAGDWKADDNAIRWAEIEARNRALGQGGERVGLAKDRAAALADPESALLRAKAVTAERVAGAGVRGRETEKHSLNDQIASDAANIATARTSAATDARQDTEASNADRTAALAAKQAADVVAAQNKAGIATPSAAELRGSKAQRDQEANDFRAKTAFDQDAAQQLDRIDTVLKKYSNIADAPGIGVGQGLVPDAARPALEASGLGGNAEDALVLSSARDLLSNARQRKESGAAGPQAEKYRYDMEVGANKNSTPEQVHVGLDAARRLTELSIRTHAAGKEDVAREVLAAGGLDSWLKPDTLPITAGAVPKVSAVVSQVRDAPMSDEGPSASERESLAKQGTAEKFRVRDPKSGKTRTVTGGARGLADYMRDFPGWELVE